jgi:hypothetical protein
VRLGDRMGARERDLLRERMRAETPGFTRDDFRPAPVTGPSRSCRLGKIGEDMGR